jgi:MFS family permease
VLAATVARPRREKAWALAGVGTFGLTTILLGLAWSKPVFLLAIIALCVTYVFAMPFLTAVAVKQDRTGGLAAAMTGWGTLMGASAPVFAGILVRDGAYANLAWMSGGATVFAVVAMMFVRSPEREAE